ncbi:MAG: hypothetical protein ABIA04_01255 [Pseudomonadota bacterium]
MKKKQSILIQIFMIFLLFSCCYSKVILPPFMQDHNLHPKYKPQTYIVSVGISHRSYENARNDAIVKIIKNISLKVEHKYTEKINLKKNASTNNEFKENQSILSDIKLSTNFKHAELIKFDEGNKIKKEDGTRYVFAYLHRADLRDALLVDFTSSLKEFQKKYAVASNLLTEGDLRKLNIYMLELKRTLEDLSNIYFQLNVLTSLNDKIKSAYTACQKDYFAATQVYENLKKNSLISIKLPEKLRSADKKKIYNKLHAVFNKLTLKVENDKTCANRDPLNYVLKMNISENCIEGLLGPSCKFDTFQAELRACSTNATIFTVDLNSKKFKAFDTHSLDKALNRLYKEFEKTPLDDNLLKELKTYFE